MNESVPRRVLLWALAGALALTALGAGIYFGERSQLQKEAFQAGDGANAVFGLNLPDQDGKEQAFAQWRGKVLVVNFWATWCAPCREEMPLFTSAQERLGPKGLQFVGIAADQAEKVREFVAETHPAYPTVIGGFGAIELSRTLGNRIGALPFTVVIDRSGHIVETQLGPFNQRKLDGILSQLL